MGVYKVVLGQTGYLRCNKPKPVCVCAVFNAGTGVEVASGFDNGFWKSA